MSIFPSQGFHAKIYPHTLATTEIDLLHQEPVSLASEDMMSAESVLVIRTVAIEKKLSAKLISDIFYIPSNYVNLAFLSRRNVNLKNIG